MRSMNTWVALLLFASHKLWMCGTLKRAQRLINCRSCWGYCNRNRLTSCKCKAIKIRNNQTSVIFKCVTTKSNESHCFYASIKTLNSDKQNQQLVDTETCYKSLLVLQEPLKGVHAHILSAVVQVPTTTTAQSLECPKAKIDKAKQELKQKQKQRLKQTQLTRCKTNWESCDKRVRLENWIIATYFGQPTAYTLHITEPKSSVS